jgi:hypothetical protein
LFLLVFLPTSATCHGMVLECLARRNLMVASRCNISAGLAERQFSGHNFTKIYKNQLSVTQA